MSSRLDCTLPFEIRTQVYSLLASLYLNPPDQPLLDALSDPTFVAEWPLGRELPAIERGLKRVAESLASASLADLRQEFWQLFGGLGPAAAPPWQSTYLDRERVVMGEETLRIRSLFARFDLSASEEARQPEDHIGLQLQFLSTLAARTAERLAAGDEAGARTLLQGQQECLEEHLLRWVEPFAARVEAASESGFYGGLTQVTLGLLRFDLGEVHRLLAEPALI